MAAAAVPFSIHQELWHDCWVAATSAVRTRRRQVDFDIQQRVARLMEEYGPQGEMPLTLRVYGTMIKGFCVINNERARALHADCERLVFAFAQKPFGDEGKAMRLPPTKRKHAEALTLDLDLAKVQESEAFDWTQAPLEEGALLQLLPQPEGGFFGSAPSALDVGAAGGALLMGQGELLEVTFPALDIPMVQEPIDLTASAAAAAATGDAAAAEAAGMLPPGYVEEVQMEAPPAAAMPPQGDEQGQAMMQVDEAAAPQQQMSLEQLALQQLQQQRRGSGLPRGAVVVEPGRVFGFDEDTTMPSEVWEGWWRDDGSITRPRVRPAGNAQLMEEIAPEHLGRLSLLLDPSASAARLAAVARLRGGPALGSMLGLGGTGLGGAPAAAAAAMEQGPPKADGFDGGFAPGDAAAAALDAAWQPMGAAPLSPGGGDGGQAGAYDEQTAQVADVLRHYLAADAGRGSASLDDLLPPSSTDKVTAARTFHALLALATSGEFLVAQSAPYAPIAVAVA